MKEKISQTEHKVISSVSGCDSKGCEQTISDELNVNWKKKKKSNYYFNEATNSRIVLWKNFTHVFIAMCGMNFEFL